MIKKIGVFVMILTSLCVPSVFAVGYRVMGDFRPTDKTASDELKVDLAALTKITESEKLEVVQSKDQEDKEQISLDIVFKDDLEARDYFIQLAKQNQDGRITIHRCTNSEYIGQPNVSCILEDGISLIKQ